jgi:hypothetical protein
VAVSAGQTSALVDALTNLRARLSACRLDLEVAGASEARRARAEMVAQIDDYLLPRLSALDAPLLAVVGGSTGAGKSTLVNSLVGTEVSPPGVLRPTTRAPVLVCHPQDIGWWQDDRVLPGLARASGVPTDDPGTLRVVAHDRVPTGIALLDAPDIDSVVASNRALAAQLLAAADLWIFVTTAARYSDAVPWEFLRTARARSTALALVLNRVPAEAEAEVPQHLASLLTREGLGDAPVFTVPETALHEGLIPGAVIGGLRDWLTDLSSDAAERAHVVRTTLHGALDSIDERVALVAAGVAAQTQASESLLADADAAYARARAEIEDALSGGSLLRGEVLARWHDVVGTGDLMRSLESRIGWLRDRLRAVVLGEAPPAEELQASLGGSVSTVVVSAVEAASERASTAWRSTPAGAALLRQSNHSLERSSPGFPALVSDEVRAWQGDILELVRAEGASKRATGRALSFGVNAVGAALMVAVFAQTGGLTGAEVAIAGGTATVSQKLLEALFGDQAVRELTARARTALLARLDRLLAAERERFRAAALAAAPRAGEDRTLRATADAVRAARA